MEPGTQVVLSEVCLIPPSSLVRFSCWYWQSVLHSLSPVKLPYLQLIGQCKKNVGLGCFVPSTDITCKVRILLAVNHSTSVEAGKPGSVASTTPLVKQGCFKVCPHVLHAVLGVD